MVATHPDVKGCPSVGNSSPLSVMDLFFPGFGFIFNSAQQLLNGNLNSFTQLLCVCGALIIFARYIFYYITKAVINYYSVTLHVSYYSEAHDMLVDWMAHQPFVDNAHSQIARVKSSPRNITQAKKFLTFSPWDGSFWFWFKGHLIILHCAVKDHREDFYITSIGRSAKIVKQLLEECRKEYLSVNRGKVSVFEHDKDGEWRKAGFRPIRPMDTVIMDKRAKDDMLEDIEKFLHENTQRWYEEHGIPYRRGYLLYGPPGTGKSSFSLSIAGKFDLDIYLLNLSGVCDSKLSKLFAGLPPHCVVLLEDVDAAGLIGRHSVAAGQKDTPSLGVTLSGLLNALDGVSSQEGRVVIMTTNHKWHLDEALLRPGRVDKKVYFKLADRGITAQLFRTIYKKMPDAHKCLREEINSQVVDKLADQFAAKVPEHVFSPAEVLSFLLEHPESPEGAVTDVEGWVVKTKNAKEVTSRAECSPIDDDLMPCTPPTTPTLQFSNPVRPNELERRLTTCVQAPSQSECTDIDDDDLMPCTPPTTPTLQFSNPVRPNELERRLTTCVQAPSQSECTDIDDDASAPKAKFQKGKPDSLPKNMSMNSSCTLFSETITMSHLKDLFTAALEQRPRLADLESTPEKMIESGKFKDNKRTRASKLEFKIITEAWDKGTSKYKIVESTNSQPELEDLDEFVFVIRRRADRRSGDLMSFVDIKSEPLRDILRKILNGVRAVSLIEDKPSIDLNTLFHFLPQLNKHVENIRGAAEDKTYQLKHLTLLANCIQELHATTLQRVSPLLESQQITYDLLWALFKPGDMVYSTCLGTGKPRCVIFDAGEEVVHPEITYYMLECRYLDFDGQDFGETGTRLGIAKFRGAKAISSLEAFPLHYHQNLEPLRKQLVECGRKFCQLTNTHIQHCNGTAFIMIKGEPVQKNIKGRVAVDAAFFREMRPNYSRPRIEGKWQKDSEWIFGDIDIIADSAGTGGKRRLRVEEISEDDLLICCPTVCCFSFQEKAFMECAVADLHDVEWCPESFDCLKIPDVTKQILSALAKTRLGVVPTVPFDDVIESKGRGINVLLHGPTGVGKTFTVEATAEWFRLPLYSISAGELVADHGDLHVLESRLDDIFKIAKNFKAVLLLDEADAFMEKRVSYLDSHNRLVTVFLRKLEYYEGILFLTSNRAVDIDGAILSRIHMKIKYDDLTKELRKDIWVYFLSGARTQQGPSLITDDELQRLGSISVNGREIRNLVSIAHAVATVDKKQVNYHYLEMAANTNEKFVNEFIRSGHIQSMYS